MMGALEQAIETSQFLETADGNFSGIEVNTNGCARMYCRSCGISGCLHDHMAYVDSLKAIKLDGAVDIDIKKSTKNTAILKQLLEGLEDLGPINIYIHHDRGPGRVEDP